MVMPAMLRSTGDRAFPEVYLPDASWSKVSSLLHFDGINAATGFKDELGKPWVAAGNAQLTTAQKAFGAAAFVGDGVGDYIYTSNSPDFAYGVGDFTVEMAIRLAALPTYSDGASANLYSQLEASTGLTLQYRTYPTNRLVVFHGSATEVGSFPVTLSTNVWYRIALCRASGVLRVFVDGVKVGGDVASPHDFTAVSQGPQIGGFVYASTYYGGLNGWVDEFRATKGVARYTVNYDVASEPFWYPDQYLSAVVALLHFDGANGSTTITDQKGHTFTIGGGAALSTAQQRFGGSSLYLNGTSQYIQSATSVDWDMGSNDFTIEMFIRPAAAITARQDLLNRFSTYGLGINIFDSGVLRAYSTTAADGLVYITGSTVVTHDVWHHIAYVRSGSTLYLFLDGVLQGSATLSGEYAAISQDLTIGRDPAGTRHFNGYIDEFRITKGAARYVSNFSPPDLPFSHTAVGGVGLDPASTASGGLVSNARRTLTRNGGTAVCSRTNLGYTSGLRYFEARIDALETAFPAVGLQTAATSLSTDLGQEANEYGLRSEGALYRNATYVPSWAAAFAVGDVFMVAVNFATKKIWFGKNGVWLNSGNPATDANPAATFTTTAALFPTAQVNGASQITMRFSEADLSYPVPSGFSVW